MIKTVCVKSAVITTFLENAAKAALRFAS